MIHVHAHVITRACHVLLCVHIGYACTGGYIILGPWKLPTSMGCPILECRGCT